jgi:hypothetical protein
MSPQHTHPARPKRPPLALRIAKNRRLYERGNEVLCVNLHTPNPETFIWQTTTTAREIDESRQTSFHASHPRNLTLPTRPCRGSNVETESPALHIRP